MECQAWTTWSSAPDFWTMSMAALAARAASSEPSLASRIFSTGKVVSCVTPFCSILILELGFPGEGGSIGVWNARGDDGLATQGHERGVEVDRTAMISVHQNVDGFRGYW